MVKLGWDKLKRLLAQANIWTGQQTFSDIVVTGGTIGGATITEAFTALTNPAANAAVTTTIVDSYNGVVVTLSAAGNTQTIQNPTTAATIRKFMIINNDTSSNNLSVVANSVTFTLTPGEGQCFIWDGSAWGPTDLGITDIPVKVTQGGTGLVTITDHGIMLGSGADPVTVLTPLAAGELLVGVGSADPHALAAGAATKILVGGGASDPVWTEATGSGAPVRATSPTLVTPALGTPASGDLRNCSAPTEALKGVTVYAGTTKALAGTDTASAMTPADVKNKVAVDVNPKAMSQGVAMTAAASGSNGITVADNDNIDYGTGNFFGVISVLLADYTPAAEVVLEQKTDGTNGRKFTLQTNGKLRVTINTTDYDSTIATGCTDNTTHVFGYSVTRETAAAAGSIIFVVDGVQLGDAVAITAGAPTTINNAVSQYVLGTSATRTAGTVNGHVSGNRALTTAEHLELYRNGISYADKWGSQTAVSSDTAWTGASGATPPAGWLDYSPTGTPAFTILDLSGVANLTSTTLQFESSAGFCQIYKNNISTIGKKYRIYFAYRYNGTSGRINLGGAEGVYSFTNTGLSGDGVLGSFEITAVSTQLAVSVDINETLQIAYINIYEIGATLALESPNIQPAPGQWLDSSSNKLHALQPAAGSSLTRYKKDFEFRWTNAWTASSAAQYVGGLNQSILTSKHFITSIVSRATTTTDIENITIGDGSVADYYVTAVAPTATPIIHTLAKNLNDGSNLKLTVTPAAEATMMIEFIIRGYLLE